MSKKSQIYRADDYESASEPELDTLIGRNFSKPPRKKRHSSGKENRKEKKTPKPKKSATPRKKRERAQSAPPGHTGRDIWLSAIKNRQTVGLLNHRPGSPRHKTPTEYWVDTLRKTGQGISTESTGTNTFSGLKKPREKDMPYLSTSSYLRQMVGTEKAKKHDSPTTRPAMGTPAYKSQEEYYDQILELKKQIQNLNQDNATLKAKVRRTEEDNIKKEKEIDGLLNPTKSEEMRRTLGDRRPDSGAMIHSLKQKILKLETQLKDKEASYSKLQSDLKTTKIEEMKVQLETCFHEIVRLQQSKDTGMEKSIRAKSEGGKMDKAVKDTIIRQNKQIEQLKSENQSLKRDLNKDIDDDTSSRDFADMDRRQLLSEIKKLQKKVDKRTGDSDSLVSTDSKFESRHMEREGKIQLKGSLEERLDQLDRRETELLDEVEKQKETIKRLKIYRKRCEEKEKEIQILQDELDVERGSRSGRRPVTPRKSPTSSRPPSGRKSPTGRRLSYDSTTSEDRRQKKRVEEFQENNAARKIQQEWKKKNARDKQIKEAERLRERHAAVTIQKEWKKYNREKQETEKKIQNFKENRAARKIQREWTGYQHRKHEAEVDNATELIQATMRGHHARKRRLRETRGYENDSHYGDEDYGDAVTLIQSSFKGHVHRKNKLRRSRHLDDDDEEDFEMGYSRPPSSGSYRARPGSAISRTSASSKRSNSSFTGRTTVATYPPSRYDESHDDDDDIAF